jgi:hypothetical protein
MNRYFITYSKDSKEYSGILPAEGMSIALVKAIMFLGPLGATVISAEPA